MGFRVAQLPSAIVSFLAACNGGGAGASGVPDGGPGAFPDAGNMTGFDASPSSAGGASGFDASPSSVGGAPDNGADAAACRPLSCGDAGCALFDTSPAYWTDLCRNASMLNQFFSPPMIHHGCGYFELGPGKRVWFVREWYAESTGELVGRQYFDGTCEGRIPPPGCDWATCFPCDGPLPILPYPCGS